MVPEALVSVMLGVAVWQAALYVVRRRRAIRMSSNDDPSDAERAVRYAETRSATSRILVARPGAVETALFLLTEAKASLDLMRSVSDAFVSKATTLLGLAAGASGALGVFASSSEGKSLVTTPLIGAAMICLQVAIGCALYMLRAKRGEALDLGPYISASMIAEDNRCGLALTLALAHRRSAKRLSNAIRHDPRALFLACLALYAAAGLTLVHAVVVSRHTEMLTHAGGPAAHRSVLHPPAAKPTLSNGQHQSPSSMGVQP